jgi:hypothetical protein
MDVRTRSALIITLLLFQEAAFAEYHDSLRAGLICSSETSDLKFEIAEPPDQDGFFRVESGLCKAQHINSDDSSTLFKVADCMLQDGQIFSFMFGGWLQMLTVTFEGKDETQDLFCR